MKQRFSSLDVRVITRELASEIVNLRVSNIYDLSSRIFLFKLAKPDHRRQLIVDSGFRCHVTQYSRTTATTPSQFVSRLRKALKSRRVTSVEQIGTDRIIDFSFSDGMYHMFLEFFAGGNIILTDREYNILAHFRQVPEEGVRVGLKYTVTNKQNYHGVPDITLNRIRETLQKAQELSAQEGSAPKKPKKKNVDVLRKALSQGFPEYPPLLLDHAFAMKGFDSATPLEQILQDATLLQKVFGVLEEAQDVSRQLSAGNSHPGYIVAKADTRPASEPTTEGEGGSQKPSLLYEDFHPFKPRQFEGKPGTTVLEFDRYNATVDEYFSSLESQKLESRLTEREETAKRKLDAVKQEHQKRIGALEETQGLHIHKAGAITDNVYRVQEAIDAINGLIAQGMDWMEIGRLIEMEQGRGNPVAKIIKLPLKLYENTVTLLLGEAGNVQDEDEQIFTSDESEEESENEEEKKAEVTQKQSSVLTIDIDLGLSPWANATQYYDQKKLAAEKQQKTAQSSTKALKSHEKKVTEDLKKGLKQEKQVLRPSRAPFWFEKFLFFISSEGYLVLGGRDSMQSEMLYRRHLKKGDIFVHADLQGATPMIVMNRPGTANAPIPPSTLSQAGNLSVATSSAWDSKAVMSAYWVDASQVTKTGPGGIVPTGEFVIKGDKNFLAPSQLVLGFGVMWQVSKESLRNHKTGRFDVPVTEEAPAEPVAEKNESSVQEQTTTEPTKAVENVNGKEQEQMEDEGQDSGSDEEDADQALAKNPLQRGLSESVQTTKKVPEDDDTEKGEEDIEEKADEEEEQEETPGDDEQAPGESEDQQLSARERRALRKEQLEAGPGKPAPTGKSSKEAKQSATKQAPPAPSRGKKAKSKKAAAKYADQDEEERELALRVLGGKSAKSEKAAAATAAKEARDREAEAAKERRKAQHERAAESERKRQALFEDGADHYDEETAAAEAADLSWIPALVGAPHPEDEILAAIPVCAPWAALGRYKYRVKLQPGAVKKGKAVKEILGRWVSETTTGKVKKEQAEDAGISLAHAERIRAREGELIKAWKDTEIINTMPVGKVRIMGVGSAGGGGGKGGGGDSKGKGKGGNANKGGGKGGKKK